MKEILPDGRNGIDENGDVTALDQVIWEPCEHVDRDDHHWEDEQYEFETRHADTEPGAFVSLEARAFALGAIMHYFNQANRRSGMSRSRSYNGFDSRYGRNASAMEQKMSSKEGRLHAEFMKAVGVLVAQDGMLAAGFDRVEIEATKKELVDELRKQYGPGNAYAKERSRLVHKAERAAQYHEPEKVTHPRMVV